MSILVIAVGASLLLVGDSYTFGKISGPAGLSYAELLEDELAPTVVVNAGILASTTGDWLPDGAFYTNRILPEMPCAVSLLLGTVDALDEPDQERPPIAPEEYSQNLAAIVDQLILDGAPAVYLSTPPQNHFMATGETLERLVAYREIVRALCLASADDEVECGADLGLLLEPRHYTGLDIHPNIEGHSLIASEILLALPEASTATLNAIALIVLGALRRHPRTGRSQKGARPRPGRRNPKRSSLLRVPQRRPTI